MIFPIVFVQILSNLPLLFVNFQFTVNIFKNIYKNQNHLEKPTKNIFQKKTSNSNNKNNKPYKNNKKTELCKKTKKTQQILLFYKPEAEIKLLTSGPLLWLNSLAVKGI